MTSLPEVVLHDVTPAELADRLASSTLTLIDVREPAEFLAERIPGARSLPLSQFETTPPPLASDGEVVLYCRTGNRSAQAARQWLEAGAPEVHHLAGGLEAWKKTGGDVIREPRAPISILRQVQMIAGSLVVLGTVLGALVSPWFLLLSGGVGAGLFVAGATDTCGMALMLARMPWNRVVVPVSCAWKGSPPDVKS